jgi:thiamine monophosphate kinase
MTNEEHIKNLETIGYDGWTVTEEAYKSLQYAITVLKQEPILDKIRAEIQNLRNCSCSCSDGIIDDVEDIIDKYEVESEE